ncbi:GATA transcription factor 9 [Raphanus sativus]|uniref:GATA transcription factor n=1 Tax=Raphanus sativus TaxID=3726 RepID=A0A6J0N8E8_RAPSA|nr:GATA transcription factor 9 [Raphanus sativus]XP_056853642.1 GATA transcription factor 9-like [Raphanus sativus]KAJ4871170.1 GATA transcription factor 9 [Raphanus sativus]KAJ4899190.1 GATA transcription factor 9 [Raphanus sativus]
MEQQQQQPPTPELLLVAGNADSFVVDDLLDFSNDNGQPEDVFESSPDSSVVSAGTLADSSNSSSLFTDGSSFSDDLCVPCEDLAELEWLSNFVEESFSKEDQDKLQLLSGLQKPQTTGLTQTYQTKPEPEPEPELDQIFILTDTDDSNVSFPAKARSKRSRSAASTWASRLLALAGGSDEPFPKKKQHHRVIKEHDFAGETDGDSGEAGGERRCLHCATDKTPQWRTGPMGPKTLCNACGVRYKSGRLVPEYRPASSPTFVTARHSNSHRKVMELRRQKEMRDEHLLSQLRSNGEDFLIHCNNNHVAPDFRHLI